MSTDRQPLPAPAMPPAAAPNRAQRRALARIAKACAHPFLCPDVAEPICGSCGIPMKVAA